ncbi:MAG: DUF3631 domain-containing protein [Chloroflexota bacterium]|nr:DUF3631 domain-containing protein [Chloroflexota bacterium]
MSASTATRPRDLGDVLAKLPDARKSGEGWVASCPCPGHETPERQLSLKDAGSLALVKCQGGKHSYREICSMLGFGALSYGDGKAPTRRQTTTRYPIRGTSGQVGAVHVRRDGPKGKAFHWELPNGTPGLGGIRVADLPLYGSERLEGLSDGTPVVVCEGEKATDALGNTTPAVGTVTGAGGTPGLEALRPLVRLRPLLWADADDVGRAHMERLAARLRELGCQAVRMVDWPDAPPAGDAADAVAQGVDIAALLERAAPVAMVKAADLGLLLEDVEAFIRRYLATGASQLAALALWVLHSWTLEAAETTPYLHVTSPEKQSGKTRLLEALALMVARPWFTSRVSAAVLVRKVARDAPTLLLDETDSAFKVEDYSEALRGILNAGYRRGGVASLCVKAGGDFTLVDFPVFSLKALAGIGELPDTVADRSIRISLKRRAPTERVERFRLRDAQAQAAPIRERLERWANIAVAKLADARPTIPDELSDRQADVWEPLLAIADLAGGQWPARAREAALVLSASVVENGYSFGVRLLHDIREVLGDRTCPIPTSELLEGLVALEEAPWGDLKGKALDARRLSRILKPYGIKPKVFRTGATTPRGYESADFEDAWARYCACTPGISATSATSATKSAARLNLGTESVADVAAVADAGGIHAHAANGVVV